MGSHSLTAVAYDAAGLFSVSPAVPVNIVPFGITKVEATADGNCLITATGAPGSTYEVRVTGDMVNWQVLKTVTNASGTVQFTDDAASQTAQRFYRLVVVAEAATTSGVKTNALARR